MRSKKIEDRSSRDVAHTVGGIVLALFVTVVSNGQETPRRSASGGPVPSLPGAVTKPPKWLIADAPFDVATFFKATPRDKNAAPLYLDALFEFGSDVEICFPEGPQRTRRRDASRARVSQYMDLARTVEADVNLELDAAAVDALIKLYGAGYRKLAEAQRLSQCVFESGFDIAAMLPHAQVARQVARISSLKVQRAVQRGDIAAAIHEIETILRLTRDLRPRGVFITQLVADACSQLTYSSMVPAVLSSPRLRAEQSERLLQLLETHDAKSIDGYADGLRAEFIAARSTLESIVHDQSKLAARLGLKPGESVVRAIERTAAPPEAPAGDAAAPLSRDEWDSMVARAKHADVARQAKEITRYYANLLEMSPVPYAPRIKKIAALKLPSATDPLSRVVSALLQTGKMEAVARAAARSTASLRAMECLVALKRWQISHRGLPKDMSAVVKGAGLKAVPLDPYDGKPMKLAVIDGEPVMYSIGRDGLDQVGRIDCDRDIKPSGDLIYRLPVIEQKLKLRP